VFYVDEKMQISAEVDAHVDLAAMPGLSVSTLTFRRLMSTIVDVPHR